MIGKDLKQASWAILTPLLLGSAWAVDGLANNWECVFHI